MINEYDQLLDEEFGDQKSSLQQSMFAAQNQEPERQAQVLKLAQATNLPAQIVDRNFDDVRKRQQQSTFDYDGLIESSPHLATWLETPENAGLAKDDTDNLSALEGKLGDLSFGQKVWQALNAGVSQASSLVASAPAAAYDLAVLPYNLEVQKNLRDAPVRDRLPDSTFGYDAFGRVIDDSPMGPTEYVNAPDALANNVVKQAFDAEVKQYQERVPELSQSALATANLPDLDKNFWSNLSKTNIKGAAKVALLQLVQSAPQQALMMITGARYGQAAGLAYAGATSMAGKADENRAAGINPATGTVGALASGSVEGAFESFGTFGILKSWENAITKTAGKQVTRQIFYDMGKQLASSVAGEANEEALTSVAQDVIDFGTGLNPEFQPGKMAENAFNAGLLGGLSGGILTSPGGVAVGLQRQGAVANAKMLKNFYLSFGESALATKLRQRLPEKQRELVEQMTKDSAVENVYISAEAIDQRFNQDGKSPVQAMNELGFGAQYEQAKETGLDLRIPLAQWVDKVGDQPQFVALADDVKFSPDQRSVGEINTEQAAEAAATEETRQQVAEEAARAKEAEEIEAQNERVSSLVQNISDQLVATGRYDEQTVRTYAPLLEERLKRRAEIRGEDPADLLARQNLTVERAEQIAPAEGLNQGAVARLAVSPEDSQELARAKELLAQIDTAEKATALKGEARAQYLAALDRVYGDQAARAKAIGLDLSKPQYHGTGANIEAFRESDRGTFGPGVYTTPNTREASTYANKADEGGNVLEVVTPPAAKYFDGTNGDVTQVPGFNELTTEEQYDVRYSHEARARFLAERGYVGVTETRGREKYRNTFEASNLRSVNAAFDPRFADSTLILAQSGREWQTTVPMPAQVETTNVEENVGSPADVFAAARDRFAGQKYTNRHTGESIEFTNNGLKKARQTLATPANRLAMANLDSLIEKAIYARTEDDKGGGDQPVDIYYARMTSPSKEYLVRIVVREAEGKKFYDKFAIEKETNRPTTSDQTAGQATGEAPSESVDDRGTLDQPKTEVDSASAITPENATRTSTIPIEQFKAEVKTAQARDPFFQNERGQIQLSGAGVKILLGPGTDRSTFLHELGHLWLAEMGEDVSHLTKLDPDQLTVEQRQFLKDSDTVLEWLGAASWDKVSTEQHEQWARGAEAYFMEGKAPSERLAQAFKRFRQWLTGIYRSIKGLNVTLSDDVRTVFDRLLASDEAIQSAKTKLDTPILFNDPRRMGMSEAKTYEYLNAQSLAQMEAEQQLDEKLMKELNRQQTKTYNERREAVEASVRTELATAPAHIAKAVLQRGVLPDGSPLPDGMNAIKLSKTALTELIGDARVKRLPKPFVYARDGGVHPATAAEMFGFANAQELIQSLESTPKFEDAIRLETDSRMKAEYGDLQTDGRLPSEALKAIHNDKRSQLLQKELEILMQENLPVFKEVVRRVSRPIPKIDQVRAQAEGIILSTQIRDIKPIAFERAQSKYAKRAVELMLKGDFNAAFEAKTKELLNHELHRAATEAIETADKTAEYMKKFRKESKRQQLGRTDYLEQIDSILARFQFARVTNKDLERREKSLAEWIEQKQKAGESNGEEVFAADFLKDERIAKNYRQLTYEEMLGVRDLVRQIEHMAIQSDKLLAQEKRVRKGDVKQELITALRANLDKKPPRPFTKDGTKAVERVKSKFKEYDSSLIKMEQVIDIFDGGDIAGPWHEYLWHRASDAQNAEYDYTANLTAKIAKLVLGMPKELRARMSDEVTVPGIERKMVRRDLIGVALNVGNNGNYQKLIEGHGWTDDQVRIMLDNLTETEWQFVQGIWDTLETMWPDIAKLQKELTGIEPDKIAIRPVTTKFGTLKGGYYPLMYDSIASEQGALQLSTRAGGLVEDAYTRATTPKGHTKSRVQGFSAPIDLDLDNLPSHVAGVVKDLTHRKWLIDANFIVNDREIRGAVADYLGPEYVPMMQDWVRQIVNDRNAPNTKSLSVWRRMVDGFRFNATVAAMGFKVSTLIAQVADFSVAIENVGGKDLDGPKWMVKGYSIFVRNPLRALDMVAEKSGEMRHRFETKDREFRDKLRSLEGKTDVLSKLQETALGGIHIVEMSLALPTWLGAYEKAIDQGFTEDLAVRSADKAVRLSLGASGAKDLAGVMAKNDTFMRVMTMFYTPFSALYARMRKVGHDAVQDRDLSQLAVRAFLVWTIPATIGELILGRGPGDDADEEAWLKWWLKSNAMYPFQSVPMLRDVVSGVFSDYGYNFSPLAQVGKVTAEAVKTAHDVAAGDKEIEELVKKTLKASGFWLGIPSGQIEITGSYIMDLYRGNENPESMGEFAHHLLMRRERE